MARYPCEAASPEAFVQRLALDCVPYGYHFYTVGSIPPGRDPVEVDRSILRRYGIAVSRRTRYRRKKAGLANAHYLRYGRFFVIIASAGPHPFRDREGEFVKDVRERPVRFGGYSIGYRRSKGGNTWHPSVRIERTEFAVLKREFAGLATRRTAGELGRLLRSLPFEPYAPVREQFLGLLRLVNRRRRAAGLDPVPAGALRMWRKSVRRFE